ncbi:MAG: nicotinate (nicotinamide) nucleotide adenylyltransferase [Bdellovibrionales bacterium]|nr:nicotinate (nicotinamide) nucleotide adenylyltransferase [Bdellovibrionales bacterium]
MSNDKVGIFGGSFSPFHNGHLNTILGLLKAARFSRIHVVVANQNPQKILTDEPSGDQRFEMVKLGTKEHSDRVIADDREIRRGGPSFTIDTVKSFQNQARPENLYLIMGVDAFEGFAKWKSWEEILKTTNLLVTTRPGYQLPQSREEISEPFRGQIEKFSPRRIELKGGRHVEFVELNDVDVSATELRRKLRAGDYESVEIPPAITTFIQKNELYKSLSGRIPDYREFTAICAQWLFDKKAFNLRGLDLTKQQGVTDFAIIASGTSTRHTASLAENLVSEVKKEFGVLPLSVEGLHEGRWVLVDYGSLIVHLFYDFVRQEYRLEELWRSARDLELTDKTPQK